MTPSFRTTLLGVFAIVSAVVGAATCYVKTGNFQNVDLPTLIASVTAGWGLIYARDQAAHVADLKADAASDAATPPVIPPVVPPRI